MTVFGLIEELQAMPQEAPVLLFVQDEYIVPAFSICLVTDLTGLPQVIIEDNMYQGDEGK